LDTNTKLTETSYLARKFSWTSGASAAYCLFVPENARFRRLKLPFFVRYTRSYWAATPIDHVAKLNVVCAVLLSSGKSRVGWLPRRVGQSNSALAAPGNNKQFQTDTSNSSRLTLVAW